MPDASDSQILTALMETTPDAVVVLDDTGTILRANGATSHLFGHAAPDLPGMDIRTLLPEDAWTRTASVAGSARHVDGIRKDGTVFPLRLSVGSAHTGDTDVYVAILHDRTARVASENALARTMRLDAVGQMTGGISHDFNNLLTIIIGNLELAEQAEPDARMARYLTHAMDAAESGANLTARLMIFARKGSLQPVVSDVGAICRRTIDMLERTLGASYTIAVNCPTTVSPVLVDPGQLESALINLAVNARDAMPHGGHLLFQVEEITIDDTYMAQETDVAPGRYVRLLVSDDGEGMPPESQARAFEPFFTTKPAGSGTGLGLAMVYGFVRQSGGHITLYSELGHGTSIGLYFPALPPSEATGPDARSGAATADLPMGHGERILLVEDSDRVRQITVSRLGALGYDVDTVDDGDAAWRMLQGGAKVDLVFSDVVMPGTLNGFDLRARIRDAYPDLPVLLTSGYASDVVTGRMRGSEPVEILHKPYRLHDLARRLSALLSSPPG
ncbi:ATP-binding protein [Roseivivax sp. CAU 1753]